MASNSDVFICSSGRLSKSLSFPEDEFRREIHFLTFIRCDLPETVTQQLNHMVQGAFHTFL